MLVYLILYAAGLSVLNGEHLTPYKDCPCLAAYNKGVKIRTLTTRNAAGQWVTNSTANGIDDEMPDGFAFTVEQTVLTGGNVLVEGEFGFECPKLASDEPSGKDLVFYKRAGKNIKFSNFGRTAQRIHPGVEFKEAILITSRPLKDDELFEVRLDEVVNIWTGSIEFGLTTKTPTEVPLLPYFGDYDKKDFVFYGYQNFSTSELDVPKLWDYQKGDRFAVKMMPNKDVMFYVNGVLVGVSNTNFQSNFYGIVDLYGNGVKATIVNPP